MSLSPLEKAASGALASAIANTIVYPLDLSKTIVQTQIKPSGRRRSSGSDGAPARPAASSEPQYKSAVDVLHKIYQKKGVLGWYHGLLSSIFGTAAQNFSYFYWYSLVRSAYARVTRTAALHKHSTAVELFLGALAAGISQLFTMPIGVITTQQQTDKSHKSLYQLARDIYAQDGLAGFWRGLSVSLVLCINPSITYGSYERLKQILFDNKEFLGPLESFTLGMCAKSLATLATQPLIVSKAMLQKKQNGKPHADASAALDASGKIEMVERAAGAAHVETRTVDTWDDDSDDVKFDSFVQALSHLWETEQFRGLYKGVAPQLLKGVIVQGMLFMFKDQIDMVFVVLLKMMKRKVVRNKI